MLGFEDYTSQPKIKGHLISINTGIADEKHPPLPLKSLINVLQYNPTSNSKIRAPQKQEMVAFKHQLEQTGLEVTMRVSHGREIKAACGQLANTYNKAKKQQK